FTVLILGWVFVPFYLKSGVFTMPEFLERRYNKTCRMYLTSISIVAYVLTKISVTLFAGGLLLNKVLGLDITTSAIVLVILTGIYTILGGLNAVIYTDIVQTVILVLGALTLTMIGLNQVGGFSGLEQKLPPEFFSMFKPMSDPDFPWTGIIFGAPILGIWYWCTDQYIVQRVLSARHINHARSGTIMAGFLKILPVFMLVLPGMIAVALYPEIQGDMAYPTLVTSPILPTGVRGLVIASLLAALMSSLASCFNSSSTLFTMDFYKHFKPQASERELVTVGRLATGCMVILGILWVPFIKYISSQIYIYLQSVQGYISPPIAAVFVFGIFWKRVNARGAIWALISGGVLGVIRLVIELAVKAGSITHPFWVGLASINFLHYAIFLFIVSALILIIVSLMSEAPAASKVAGLTFQTVQTTEVSEPARRMDVKNPIWHRLNIILSIILILTVIALWIRFF
ncbi:MAG: sodium:solute symporter, partial [Candidatus Delongbacteria bacterium]|nr:sodium:solute symporter [Candidatus Delongbacteria bacterium]